jgi:spore coat polysaccharide biosynthesis protein SpsF
MVVLRNRPALEWVILRALRSSSLEKVVLATTVNPEDDVIAGLGERFDLSVIRGSLENVLNRYADAISKFPSEAVVRITGDNPLIDPDIIDNVVDYFFENALDYCYAAQIPYGAGVDVFRSSELVFLAKEVNDPRYREHINTYYIDNHLKYRLGSLPPGKYHKRPDVRVTLDNSKDLERLRGLFQLIENPIQCGLIEIISAYDKLPESLK